MIDLERDHLRKTYQLCRMGFAIISLALILASFTSILSLVDGFTHRRLFFWIFQAPWYQWVDAPIVWGSLLGTTLLWGRWAHVSWQRRTGMLLLMCLVDVGLWLLDQGNAIGQLDSRWFRSHLGEALGWAEFALLASLSCDYLVHLGLDHADDSGKSTRSLAATGAILWILLFCQQTNWGAGWPLRPRRFLNLEGLLLSLGWTMIWTITLIQVTALTIAAVRHSNRVLNEMDREDQDHELLRLPSESDREFELLGAEKDRSGKDPWSSGF